MSALPVIIVAALFLSAMLSALVGMWRRTLAYVIALGGVAVSLLAAVLGLFRVLDGGELRHYIGGWEPPLGIEYVMDPISAFMTVIITSIGLLLLIYPPDVGLSQSPRRGVPLYGLVLLLLAGLAGVAITGDLFNLFVFLEIYALASYALVTLRGGAAYMATFRYLILGTIGAGFYLLGAGFLYFSTGSLNMADVSRLLPPLFGTPAVTAALALIILGLGIKMALFPLHVWLPDAHTEAPPVMAALLASVQIEVSAYALIRILLTVFQPQYLDGLMVTHIIGWFAAAGIVVSSVMAIAQKDFKRMLAYSTVGQVAYIGLGISLANPMGLIGALLHILNHAFMKSCLFLVAGGIRQQTGFTDMTRFAGLGRRMPLTMTAFTVAALSMVGIPPTAGFFSKWYLALGSLDAGNWGFIAVILLSSLLNAVYFFRIIEKVWATSARSDSPVETAREPSRRITAPIALLALGVLALGLINAVIVTRVLGPAVAQLMG
ncbi:MAG: monovalent cation/H+ antiporter subunit D family protein [Chloroflexi bacterium]|nr:monovalent cation/H+ antiporter subunit D family protein [Chloroflexota bacterium]